MLNITKNYNKIVVVVVALLTSVSALSIISTIEATHDDTDVRHRMSTSAISSNNCSATGPWISAGSVGEPTGSGTKRVAASLHWYEGYNDLDLRLKDPNGNYTTSALPVGYIDEETYPLTWYSGTYRIEVRCYYYDSTRDTDGNVEYNVMLTNWRPRSGN